MPKPVYDNVGIRNDGSIECPRWCAEINRPDADFGSELSLSADCSGSKRDAKVKEKKEKASSGRTATKYDYPLVDGREMTSEEKKKYNSKLRICEGDNSSFVTTISAS